ncbi:MAG: carbohydrate binding family 9 domain-containing protein [Ignavibacteriae bacterium]|nr:carbohydrate binding family 9 domain-containing protein [Ignavibacteriota bacterium]
MLKILYFPILLLLSTCFLFEVAVSNELDTTLTRPTVVALRVTNPVTIDGILSEQEWQRSGITSFTQREPIEGSQPTQKTEVWVAYDDAALYVAARLYDSAPDSIIRRTGRRDSDLSSDWFYVGIDSYHDRRTGFFFGVYASGSIVDGILYNDSWDDDSWDGVWDAVTTVDDKGWTVEMRIPYSQLRFPKKDEYIWGVNFARQIERRKEEDYFVMVPKKESGWVSRFADLIGIRDINPPPRIEILPYAVSSFKETNQFERNNPFRDGTTFSGNTGADFKIGLGSNLTLNATINPDFGQVEVDPAVVNLTQFETFFEEKRPFFIEGSNFFDFGYGGANNNWGFNWGSPNFFYSRRIGRPPRGSVQHDGYADIPDGTTILAAGKITGKIKESWSLASLHAFTEREYAQVEDSSGKRYDDVVEPFASYNVIRSQREFNQGRQAIGIIGTAVLRDLNQSYLVDNFNRRSYALGIDGWTNLDSDQKYVITGWFAGTRVKGTSKRILTLQQSPLHYFQRPDADHVSIDPNATSLSGYAGRVAINKQKGNVRFNTALGIISPGFESNDLGFLFRTDVINAHIVIGYSWFQPDGLFRRKSFNVATFRNYDFGGHKISDGYFLFYGGQFMNYWSFDGNLVFNPAVLDNRNTRGGPMMKTTNAYGGFMYMSTDGRKDFVFNMEIDGGRSESGGYRFGFGPGIEWKPSTNLNCRVSPWFFRDITIAQWVTNQEDATATNTYGSRYVFAKLDQKEFSSSIRVDWTFTPKLSLQLYLQPLISAGLYNEFKELKQPGTYTFNRYGEDNGSTISQADHDYYLYPDPNDLTDSIKISKGDYVVDADGVGLSLPFKISNLNFNFKSLRGNVVLRWEYLPGSTAYLVWTQSRTNLDNPGELKFGRDFRRLLLAPDHENVFLIKIAYWLNPSTLRF